MNQEKKSEKTFQDGQTSVTIHVIDEDAEAEKRKEETLVFSSSFFLLPCKCTPAQFFFL